MATLESIWTARGCIKVGDYGILPATDTPCKVVKIETVYGHGTTLVINTDAGEKRIKPSEIVAGEIF